MLTAMNSGRGWPSQFFVKDQRLALAPKVCPEQSQPLKEVNNGHAITFQAFQGMFVQGFAQIFEELTAYDQYLVKFNARNRMYTKTN